MSGILKNIFDFAKSDRGQRLGAGLRGMGAGLLQAGAPRVGAPGPNAWGVGMGGFSGGVDAYDKQAQAEEIQALQKQMIKARLDDQKRKQADALRVDRLKNQAMGMGQDGPTVAAGQRMNAMSPQEKLGWELAPQQMVAGMYNEPRKESAFDVWRSRNPNAPVKEFYDISRPKGTTVNVGGDKAMTGRLETLNDRMDSAAATQDRANRMARLAERTPTGPIAGWKLWAGQWANALGLPVDMKDVNSIEAFRAQSMDFVMDRIAGTKGSISEKEMKAFEQAGPNIMNSPSGNILVSKMMSEQARREQIIDQAEMAALESGAGMSEARKIARLKREELRKVPFLSDEELAQIAAFGQPQVQQAPPPDQNEINELLKLYPGETGG